MRTPKDRQFPNPDRSRVGAPNKRPPPSTTRAAISLSAVDLWGWPSRGGLIVLPRVTALDLTFLNLDATDFSSYSHRNPDQDLEDAFCKRLLLLGAKWFDSHARYAFVCGVAEDLDVEIQALEDGEQPPPTKMERRWVNVAWLPDGKGFWVAEFETMMRGWQERGNLPPAGAARVALVRDMQQKGAILKELGGRFFERVEEYEGGACLNAWEDKETGEVGPLVYMPYGGR
ncbi:hypothetical protein DL769_000806 [Monosporascus sp. CRB-8-3]|nr:hypothetical protein DL769_000806 [Monosporascus sp. CRB-8-3]